MGDLVLFCVLLQHLLVFRVVLKKVVKLLKISVRPKLALLYQVSHDNVLLILVLVHVALLYLACLRGYLVEFVIYKLLDELEKMNLVEASLVFVRQEARVSQNTLYAAVEPEGLHDLMICCSLLNLLLGD